MDEAKLDLRAIFSLQREQQGRWYHSADLNDEERGRIMREMLLGLQEETGELARALHKPLQFHITKDRSGPSRRVIGTECVDVFKYLICIMDLYHIGAEDFAAQFVEKTRVVEDKYTATAEHLAHEQVLLVDLDGCLADLEGGFREWLAWGKRCPEGEDPYTANINHPKYDLLKEQFQSQGNLAKLKPLYPDAVEMLNALSCKIIIVTSRPYTRYKSIYGDTTKWLDAQGLDYHHVVFTTEKASVVEQVKPAQIIGVVEDYYKYAMPLALAGVTVFKLPCSSDAVYTFEHPNLIKVEDWREIIQEIKARENKS
jgi:uncharacterized HAD superfamily protein/NTP pyrophosphatase (non-canonical NTP hydrolase)